MTMEALADPGLELDWDAPEHRFSADDSRLAIPSDHPLAATDWYRGLSPAAQIRFGREWLAQVLKCAIGFEAVLCRGMLRFAPLVPNGSNVYRQAMREVVEEGRHSIMFQELIDRMGVDPRPVTGPIALFNDIIARSGKSFPEFFFFSVLAGEIFIDQQNRETVLRDRERVHPLVQRIMRIHVAEEAGHVCLAESWLREHLPRSSAFSRVRMAWSVPFILRETRRMMLIPDRRLRRTFSIPRRALREAFGPGTEHRRTVAATAEPVYRICEEHGMMKSHHALLWRALGLRG